MDWLPKRILAKKQFPKIEHKEARGITRDEHCLIIGRERNPERRDYYELLWYTGGSQSDVADICNNDIDREKKCLLCERRKNAHLSGMELGPEALAVIERRPKTGPLFPYLRTVRACDRATEFKQHKHSGRLLRFTRSHTRERTTGARTKTA
jgi:hypothetical protein